MEATPNQGEAEHHLSDPGKEARAKAGVPVVPVFDGYRALAILGVVMLHLSGQSGLLREGDGGFVPLLINGTFGHAIDILFVVSGFVVFLPTVARGGDFGRITPYAIRRISRLFPAYWLILAIILILIVAVPSEAAPTPGIGSILFHAIGLQSPASMIFGGIATGFAVNPAVWTLSLEVTFYLVLPLIAGIYFRHPFFGLGIAAIITLAWTTGFEHISRISDQLGLELSGVELLRLIVASDLQLPAWAFSFALGMTGAWVFVRVRALPPGERRDRLIRVVLLVSAVGLAFFVWRAGSFAGETPVRLVAQVARHSVDVAIGYSACLAALMVAIALGPPWVRRPFAAPKVRQLGDISYGIFLSHLVLIYYLDEFTSLPEGGGLGSLLVWMVLVIPAAVAYGYLSARFLEQPVRRWARRFGRRAQPVSK